MGQAEESFWAEMSCGDDVRNPKYLVVHLTDQRDANISRDWGARRVSRREHTTTSGAKVIELRADPCDDTEKAQSPQSDICTLLS